MKDCSLGLCVICFGCCFSIGCCFSSQTSTDEFTNITCGDKVSDLDGYAHSSNGTEFKLICPLDCKQHIYDVYGIGPYEQKSSICRAAVHSGKLGEQGHVVIRTVQGYLPALKMGNSRNGVQSMDSHFGSRGFYVINSAVQPISASVMQPTSASFTPSALTTLSSSKEESDALGLNKTSTLSISSRVFLPNRTTPVSNNRSQTPPTMLTERSDKTTSAVVSSQSTEQVGGNIRDGSKAITIPTTNSESSLSMRTTTNSSHGLRVEMTVRTIMESNYFEKTVEKVSLVLMFVVGVVIAVGFVILRKKRKMLWRKLRKKQQRRNCGSKDDEELCVCYQTLDASTQGLLYDPDTCVRPCAMKKQEAQDYNLQMKSKSLRKTEICYEGECGDRCAGNCNPEMFEF